ncbi:unnamed protein product [Ilex paraguariensis]|uniref:Phytocyanin domain-containing protein n=1 Tax=Ilex paraguariensis TaxID=185542 RepID=A0ABC8QWF4_9AQUA
MASSVAGIFFVLLVLSGKKSSWANVFTVGDSHAFKYDKGRTVTEVDQHGFDKCDGTKGKLLDQGGHATVTLTKGVQFFISVGPSDCENGMKLSVDADGSK